MKIICSKEEYTRLAIICNRTYIEGECTEKCILKSAGVCNWITSESCSPFISMATIRENETEVSE